MCLDYFKKINIKEGIGYQYFVQTDCGHLTPLYRGKRRLKVGVWEEDTCNMRLPSARSGATYRTGFHIYLEKPGKFTYLPSRVLRLVKFTNVVATGVDNSRDVAVARRRYIVPKREEKELLLKENRYGKSKKRKSSD